MDKVNKGELTPMFFGSAMTNFGVRGFLEEYLRLAPAPQPRMTLMVLSALKMKNSLASSSKFKLI